MRHVRDFEQCRKIVFNELDCLAGTMASINDSTKVKGVPGQDCRRIVEGTFRRIWGPDGMTTVLADVRRSIMSKYTTTYVRAPKN